jgi:hypothetical protein
MSSYSNYTYTLTKSEIKSLGENHKNELTKFQITKNYGK